MTQHAAQMIRRLRTALGWSQSYLARKAGIHRNTVSAIEASSMNVDVKMSSLAAIADAFGVELHWLLKGDQGEDS